MAKTFHDSFIENVIANLKDVPGAELLYAVGEGWNGVHALVGWQEKQRYNVAMIGCSPSHETNVWASKKYPTRADMVAELPRIKSAIDDAYARGLTEALGNAD